MTEINEIQRIVHALSDLQTLSEISKGLVNKAAEIQHRINMRIGTLENQIDSIARRDSVCFNESCENRPIRMADRLKDLS
jgi:hypothetical protein